MYCYSPPGRDANPSQRYPPAVCRRYPHYTPWWRETKWSKVPCLRKQRDGRGLHPGPPDLEFEVLTARPHTLPPTNRWFIVLQPEHDHAALLLNQPPVAPRITQKNLLIFFPAWQWKLTSRYLWVCPHGFPYTSFAASSSQKFLPSHFSFTMSVDLEELIERIGRKLLI